MRQLTKKQEAVAAFMRGYQALHGMPPTLRDIARHFGWSSANTALEKLEALERKGIVKHHEGRARGWVLVPKRGTP